MVYPLAYMRLFIGGSIQNRTGTSRFCRPAPYLLTILPIYLERDTRLELAPDAWKAPMLPLTPIPQVVAYGRGRA